MQTIRQSLAALFMAISVPAAAQDAYPSRAITMIVPFAAGGTSDIIARITAEEMSKALGQPIVIENIGGAGGATGLTRAANAAPDGYTIALGNTGTNAANYWINEGLKFTPADFTAIGLVAKTSPVIALKNDFPAKTYAEFVAYAKANPKKINLGHAGVGSSNYLICLNFLKASGVDVTLVGYRGASPALNDLIGGHIDGVCDTATSLKGALEGGTAKGLVVGASKPLEQFKSIEAAGDLQLDGFQIQGWNAIFAPKALPAAILAKLESAVGTAITSERFKRQMSDLVSEAATPEEAKPAATAAFVTGEIARYKTLLGK
jgi:tripartite-type tricarboxylate transporter receptor subunit TctC